MHKEILLEKVAGIRFEFFKPPKKEASELVIKSKEEEGGWVSTWTKEEKEPKELPALIRIHLKMMGQSEEKTITFAYVVMNSEQTITYTK
jgi:hypothetical protein